MSIRSIRERDFPKIFEIYAESKLDELRFEKDRFELIRLEQDPKRWPKISEADIYVYEQGGILGFGAIYQSEIRALFVAPEARNQGIGKALLKFLISRSVGGVSLWVTSSNEPAIQLYRCHDFEIIGEFWAEYNGRQVLVSEMFRRDNGD